MTEPAQKKARGESLSLADFITTNNTEYERLHLAFEEQFWGTKMALKGEYSTEKLTATKLAMESMLGDAGKLAATRKWQASGEGSEEQRKTLAIFNKTFSCYIMESKEALALRQLTTSLEGELEAKRDTLKLGYKDAATKEFVEMSSVGLRNAMKTGPEEASRKAAYEGLCAIGPFVVHNGFPAIVKSRNRMAKLLGYEDFYDYKVTQAEGFNKKTLFEILDTLEKGSRPLMEAARNGLREDKGETALEPWNTNFLTAGDVTKKLDPYFPFDKAVERWGRCFAKLGIKYKGAQMVLDLLDRKGKYSNGFCHWPQPAWRHADGSFQPSTTNFTSLADPKAVGSGLTALTTLMHEAGHAAHFANIDQPSPLFSQERAPTSVAYAENQSMFLDSLVGDAAWRARYARNGQGEVLPWTVHEEGIRATHPFEVFQLRAMLAVPYFEKQLYELPEAEVTPERILSLAQGVELDIQGGLATRPLLSVPHILSDESSCYYHGYCLAEMSVHQTREHFLAKGPIVDNPAVGKALTEVYWQPGNSRQFLDLVQQLTGAALTGDAWIQRLQTPLSVMIAAEKKEYAEATQKSEEEEEGKEEEEEVDLEMRVRIMDGDELIADSDKEGFLPMCATFSAYIQDRFGSAK